MFEIGEDQSELACETSSSTVKAVVDVFANDAAEIFATIEKALPAAAPAA